MPPVSLFPISRKVFSSGFVKRASLFPLPALGARVYLSKESVFFKLYFRRSRDLDNPEPFFSFVASPFAPSRPHRFCPAHRALFLRLPPPLFPLFFLSIGNHSFFRFLTLTFCPRLSLSVFTLTMPWRVVFSRPPTLKRGSPLILLFCFGGEAVPFSLWFFFCAWWWTCDQIRLSRKIFLLERCKALQMVL